MTAHPDTKDCPFCGEPIKAIAKKCKHCGEFLDGYTRDKVWQEIDTGGGAVIGHDVKTGRDFIGRDQIINMGKEIRDEQYRIALDWNRKTLLREFDLSERDLSGLNFAGADLSKANLQRTDFSEAILKEAQLSRTILLNAILRAADLSGARLHKANLSGADLSGADLTAADLSGADLSRSTLFKTKLSLARLREANLRGADLSGADLTAADLSGADLTAANLRGARLHEANLSRADLSGADLTAADLSGADLTATILRSAKLPHVRRSPRNSRMNSSRVYSRFNPLSRLNTKLTGAKYNKLTVWPDEFTPSSDAIDVDKK